MKMQPVGNQEDETVVMTGVSQETYEKVIHMFDNAKQTNFDRITASVEALAEWLGNDVCTECYCCHYSGECELKGIDTKKQWLEWLKQESE